jgi:hypothetical protein
MRLALRSSLFAFVALLSACGETQGGGTPNGFPAPDAGGNAGVGGANENAAAGTSSVPQPQPPQQPPIGAEWAMTGFEDPVTISLSRHLGCFAADGTERPCGPLRVLASEGAHLTVAISFDAPGIVTYAADLWASEDGKRLAGSFLSFSAKTRDVPLPPVDTWPLGYVWLPIPSEAGYDFAQLPHTIKALPVQPFGGRFRLVKDDTGLGELLRGHDYFFAFHDTGRGFAITGDLGAFFDTELRWDEATQTLSAGPVAATRPGYPVALEVALESPISIRATTADGGSYQLLQLIEP